MFNYRKTEENGSGESERFILEKRVASFCSDLVNTGEVKITETQLTLCEAFYTGGTWIYEAVENQKIYKFSKGAKENNKKKNIETMDIQITYGNEKICRYS